MWEGLSDDSGKILQIPVLVAEQNEPKAGITTLAAVINPAYL